jgi:D-3-phosphoglycerate dehydrogenase
MERGRVVVSARLGALTDVERRLESQGAVVASAPLWSAADITANLARTDIVILGAVEPFSADVLAAMPELKAVVRRGVGYDNVDVPAATELGIVVANVPAASVEEVSDHALALCLGLERRVGSLSVVVRDGTWAADPGSIARVAGPARRFSDLTLGVVGMGRIGRALARKAEHVYGRVVGYDLAGHGDSWPEHVQPADFEALIEGADHVSLHVPMSGANHYLIDAAALARMRPGAVLVNTARGGLVDEAAVMAALASGRLGGAALDVTEREPLPADDPLLSAPPSLVLTGHGAAWGVRSTAELRDGSVAAAADLIAGRVPASVVNPEVLTAPNLRVHLDLITR